VYLPTTTPQPRHGIQQRLQSGQAAYACRARAGAHAHLEGRIFGVDIFQAAQMMSQNHPAAQRPPRTSSARPDYNKPPPATPNQRSDLPSQRQDYRQDERYGARPTSYESRPPPGAFTQDARYSSGDPRYDSRQDARYEQRPDNRMGVGSPPPANYGHGPPPQGYHGRPPIAQQSRPPPTPAPPRDANDREALWRLFGAVDKDS
jgi:hypothetical protein